MKAFRRTLTIVSVVYMFTFFISSLYGSGSDLPNRYKTPPPTPIRVQLKFTPDKSPYLKGEEISIEYRIYIDKNSPQYEPGHTYLLYTGNKKFGRDFIGKISSTLDTISYLDDVTPELKGKIVLTVLHNTPVFLPVHAYRIDKTQEWKYFDRLSIYYDQISSVNFINQLEYYIIKKHPHGSADINHLDYPDVDLDKYFKDLKHDSLKSSPKSDSIKVNKSVFGNSFKIVKNSYFDIDLHDANGNFQINTPILTCYDANNNIIFNSGCSIVGISDYDDDDYNELRFRSGGIECRAEINCGMNYELTNAYVINHYQINGKVDYECINLPAAVAHQPDIHTVCSQ